PGERQELRPVQLDRRNEPDGGARQQPDRRPRQVLERHARGRSVGGGRGDKAWIAHPGPDRGRLHRHRTPLMGSCCATIEHTPDRASTAATSFTRSSVWTLQRRLSIYRALILDSSVDEGSLVDPLVLCGARPVVGVFGHHGENGRALGAPSGADPRGALRNSAAATTRTTCPCASRIVTGAMDSSLEGNRTSSKLSFMGYASRTAPCGPTTNATS